MFKATCYMFEGVMPCKQRSMLFDTSPTLISTGASIAESVSRESYPYRCCPRQYPSLPVGSTMQPGSRREYQQVALCKKVASVKLYSDAEKTNRFPHDHTGTSFAFVGGSSAQHTRIPPRKLFDEIRPQSKHTACSEFIGVLIADTRMMSNTISATVKRLSRRRMRYDTHPTSARINLSTCSRRICFA